MHRGNRSRVGLGAALAVLGLLACAAPVQGACPDASGRLALRGQAEQAMDAGAAFDAAWTPVAEGLRDCGGGEAEASLLAEWSQAVGRSGHSDRVLLLEDARLTLAQRYGLLRHEAEARLSIALISIARGQIDPAAIQLQTALDRVRQLNDIPGQARVLTELSRLERRRGDYLAALRYELTGLDLRRRLDPPPDLWRSLLNLAVLYEQIELFDEARRHYALALAEAERNGVPDQIGDALNGYAGFLNDFGGPSSAQALPMAQRALAIHRGLGDSARIGSCLLQVGRAELGLGNLDAAERAFTETMQLAERGGFEALRAHVEFRWGELEFVRGNSKEALDRIERARNAYERQGNRHRLIKAYDLLERVHTALGDELAAAHAGREHYRLRNELLGANATGKLGELLTNFALNESELRNERLQQENGLSTLRLDGERRLRVAGYWIAAVAVAGLLLLIWRHVTVGRLYRLLRTQAGELELQRTALSEANTQLTHLNRTDALTGLATRSHGIEYLTDVLSQARVRGTTPAMVLFDLDHFKNINDHYGHLAGDHVLATAAQTLRELVPEDGLGVRVGGEEFMLVLADAPHGRAEMLADAIRRRVRDRSVDVGASEVRVTLSAGIALASPSGASTVRQLFAAADLALYAAKRAGRDCVRSQGQGADGVPGASSP